MAFKGVSGTATTKLTVVKVGRPKRDQCDVKTRDICKGKEDGEVQEFLIRDNGRKLRACPACYQRMVDSGQWAESL